MIVLRDVLTNKRWDLPDSLNAQPLHIGSVQWPPGEYDIRNGSGGALTVVYGNNFRAVIPAGAIWNICSNENTRTFKDISLDFAVWRKSGYWRG